MGEYQSEKYKSENTNNIYVYDISTIASPRAGGEGYSAHTRIDFPRSVANKVCVGRSSKAEMGEEGDSCAGKGRRTDFQSRDEYTGRYERMRD